MGSKVKLGELLLKLTDYHANGAYKILKKNVELLEMPNHAVMIRTTNFEQSDFSSNLKYINKSAYEFLSKSKVYPNDLIMNKIANAGSIYLMPDLGRPVSLAMNLFLLRVDEQKANPLYVYIYLKINELYIKTFANGSVTKTITKDAVRNLDVTLPYRFVQNSIVEYFTSFNDKISLNRQINQTLEQMAQALFKSWFVDFDPVIDNALDAGFFDAAANSELDILPPTLIARAELRKTARASDDFQALPDHIRQLFPSAFEDSQEPSVGINGWVPAGWEVMPLKSNFSLLGGFSFKSSSYENKGEFGVVTIKNVQDGSFNNVCSNFINILPEKMKSYCLIKQGDILMSLTGNVGRVCIVDKGRYVLNQRVVKIKGLNNLPNSFSYFYFREKNIFSKMLSIAKGTAQLNLSPIETLNLLAPFPPHSVLTELTEYFDSIFEKLSELNSENMDLTKLRDTLLPKLISGELRLGSPEVEQAKALVDAE